MSNQYTEYNDNPKYGNGDGAIFIGIRSIGSGHGAVTLGSLSQATANVATALGMGAKADKVASVALGAASDTNKDAAQVSNATIKGSTYSFAGTINNTTGAVVSVGNSTVQRQIINVAPGAVTATSTDAINGSQLFAVANNITKTTVAVGSESLTLSTADTTATNGLLAYTVDLSSTAKSAIADIPTIKSNLASAASTATAASSSAASAGTAAAGAVSKADAASTAASNASTAAASAASKADAASSAASSASTAAASANTAASTAQSTANVAQTTANDAKAVADKAVQNLTVGTDSTHNETGVTLTKDNNRLDIVGLGSVTTAVSGTNTINVGLTSSAESSIGAVAGISTAVTRIDGTVTNISSTVTSIDSTVSTIQTDLSTVKKDWNSVKDNAANSVQALNVGAGTGTTPITLNNKNNTLNIVGANSNANIITKVDDQNIAIDLSDSFKAQIHNLENKSNGSSITYVTNDGQKVVKIDNAFYPEGTTLDKDGKPVDAQGNKAQPTDVKPEEIKVTVGDDTARQIGNVASGLDGLAADSDATAISATEAKTAVGGADGTGGLLGKTGKDLNNVATIKDLQAVAQAGLNFTGDTEGTDNNKVTVHRPLSDTLAITGGVADVGNLTNNNIGVVADETTGLTVKLAKNIDLGADGSLNFGKDVSLTPGKGLSFAKDGGTAVYGPTGTTLTDKEGNKTITNAAGSTLTDKEENKTVISAKGTAVSDKEGNTNTSTAKENKLADDNGNSNISNATSNTITDGTNTNTSTAKENKLVDDKGNSNTANANGVTVEKTVDGKTISNSLTADALTTKGADGQETSVKADGITTNGNITATDKDGNKTTVDGNGITIDPKEDGKGNVSLTKDGLDNGGNRLKNIGAAEKSGDAVTFDQFKALERKFSAAGGMETVDENGDKVVTIDDKVYKVDQDGNPVDKNGKQLIEVDGKYYNPDDVTADGKLKSADASPAESTATGDTSLSSNAGASGLGLTKATDADEANGIEATGPISAENAKKALVGEAGKDGLLTISGKTLNKLVTVQDLQAVAQAGLDFAGDDAKDVHRPLSSKLTITGGVTEKADLTDKNIGVVRNETGDGLDVKLAKNIDLGEDGSIKLGDKAALDGKDGLTVKGDDGNSAVYGGNGLTLTDKDGNSNALTPKDSTLADNKGNKNTSTATSNALTDDKGNSNISTSTSNTLADDKGNSNTSDATSNTISDGKGNSTSNSAAGTTVKDDKGNETSVKADGVVTKDKDGNSSSMKPEGVEITDKEGNKTTVDANGISLKDKEGNALVTIDKDGLSGKDGAPVDFKNGINVPGALTVTPATKDANGNMVDPVIDAHGNRIQNVGNGILPTDAANIGQLESVRNDMKNHSNNVGSMTAALAALNPLPYIGGEKGQIMAGVGVYENKQAVALGYAYTPNSDQQYTLGVSYGEGGKTMANMGATFRIGSGDGATTLAEHVKAQTSKEYEAKLADVKAQSDAKISDLQSQVEELRQLLLAMRQG